MATLPQSFASWVARYGREPALSRRVDGVFTAFSYDELDRRASVLALALSRALDVRRGELVALISDNRPEWLVCSLAIHFLGVKRTVYDSSPRLRRTPSIQPKHSASSTDSSQVMLGQPVPRL